jgi:hypothetical protein
VISNRRQSPTSIALISEPGSAQGSEHEVQELTGER